jgi:hypothetical protein
VIRTKDSEEITLTISADTKFTRDNKEVTFADLQTGDLASATFEAQEGKNVARQIKAMPKK